MIINTVKKTYTPDAPQSSNWVHTGYIINDTNNKNHAVPLDEANKDYQAIQQWIADGGTVIDNGGGE
jgi:hypothetical protein